MERTLAIGDIHGCLASLETLTSLVSLCANDRLVLLGDYLDRGPHSKGVIEWVLNAGRSMEVVTLRGNHEVMILEARSNSTIARSWAGFGGVEALASYGTNFFEDWPAKIPPAHWRFLEATQRSFETDGFIFVHGSLDWDKPVSEQNPNVLLWEQCTRMKPHQSGKRVICGHTSHDDGYIGTYDWGVCLDTHCCGGGWLTCLDVDSGEWWQANELGQNRHGRLESV